VVPDLGAFEIVRPMGVQQSNSSLVYDERVVLKLLRQITDPSRDLEMTKALWSAGFRQVAEPIGVWARQGRDLAMAQRYLGGGVEAWALARTSLRDLFGSGNEPEIAGGDFAGDCRRIGETTAQMHRVLAQAFGSEPAEPRSWVDLMNSSLERVSDPRLDVDAARGLFDSLADLADAGSSMRIHGDYHLGQLVETDDGWFVLDFEGEPARPAAERRAPSSPLRDVAGMLRSLDYAARVVEAEHENPHGSQAESWIQRNREAFLDGYTQAVGGLDLLPSDDTSFKMILRAFELDKAIYEVGYERAHRPDWVEIPLRAVESMLA
ncbi:MAG TPA: phosphotransferase, partial [Actinomycetota bacterium]|nr:phosphotransferase [Actinomycetota bacterium]